MLIANTHRRFSTEWIDNFSIFQVDYWVSSGYLQLLKFVGFKEVIRYIVVHLERSSSCFLAVFKHVIIIFDECFEVSTTNQLGWDSLRVGTLDCSNATLKQKRHSRVKRLRPFITKRTLRTPKHILFVFFFGDTDPTSIARLAVRILNLDYFVLFRTYVCSWFILG